MKNTNHTNTVLGRSAEKKIAEYDREIVDSMADLETEFIVGDTVRALDTLAVMLDYLARDEGKFFEHNEKTNGLASILHAISFRLEKANPWGESARERWS